MFPQTPVVGWIGHAGLAGSRPGAGPSRETLSAAYGLALDWLELDVCATRDDVLVLRHHSRLPGGRPVHMLTLPELRRVEPDILTLTDAADHLRGRAALLVDIKSPRVVGPLAAWLLGHRREGVFAVCSESPDALVYMREEVPWAPRWRSLTALWRWTAELVPPLLRPLVRDLFPGAMWNATRGSGDVGEDIAAVWAALLGTEQRAERLRRIFGTAERDRLPAVLGGLAREVGAAAISVDHWVITRDLCEAAHGLDLMVAAWTVNRIEIARDLARCGVDFITSDDVATMRQAVQVLSRFDAGPAGMAVAVSCRPTGKAPPDGTAGTPLTLVRTPAPGAV
jgi:glycerophosphoryl diester phosphodiesterase